MSSTEAAMGLPGPVLRLALLLTLLLGGCASLSKDQCQTADWAALGERDAYDGQARERLQTHTKACAEHGITPDRDAWMAGHERGLYRFCQPQRGFEYGHAGSTYHNTCPVGLEASFQHGYRHGRALHSEEQRKSGLESKIRDAEKKLKKAAGDDERTKLRAQLRELDDELIDSNRKLRRLEEGIREAGLAR